jgi:biopolymer transport protein ExbD
MPEMKEGGVNVTPLIDVVMCLIIFFILVAKIGVSDGINKDIDAPKTYLGVKITDMGNALALNLYEKKGAISDEPQILVDLKGEKQKELAVQTKDGKKPLQEVLKAMKKERGDAFKVIINADQGMKYAPVQLILQECAMAGVSNINFATRRHTEAAPATPG